MYIRSQSTHTQNKIYKYLKKASTFDYFSNIIHPRVLQNFQEGVQKRQRRDNFTCQSPDEDYKLGDVTPAQKLIVGREKATEVTGNRAHGDEEQRAPIPPASLWKEPCSSVPPLQKSKAQCNLKLNAFLTKKNPMMDSA